MERNASGNGKTCVFRKISGGVLFRSGGYDWGGRSWIRVNEKSF